MWDGSISKLVVQLKQVIAMGELELRLALVAAVIHRNLFS